MPLTRQQSLTLPANPRAVKLARDWVGRVMQDIGRGDLEVSAQLGVSELVTNAIMHSAPPVGVRVRGTREHPRIEVADRSSALPQPSNLPPESLEDLDDLTTFGRGLALVALHSASWGCEVAADGAGKTVWFEPAREAGAEPSAAQGVVFDVGAHQTAALDDGAGYPVALLAAPVVGLTQTRRAFAEVRRELRLLSMTQPERYPLSVAFSAAGLDFEQQQRRTKGLAQQLAEADAQGLSRVDLQCLCPLGIAATATAILGLLDQVQHFLLEEGMLVTDLTPRHLQVKRWELGEFVHQAEGQSPRPWTGGYADHRRQNVS